MTGWLSWAATAATIGGAILTASNLGARVTGAGFVVFLAGSLAWIGVALGEGQQALLWTNVVLTALNLFGIWRWLGRQAKVEEGGKAAAEASEATPGEGLFPVSLLARAEVAAADGGAFGTCVDAMVGASSGRIAYVVVAEGGVAGVGETLRRLDWQDARVERDRLRAALDGPALGSLEVLDRDDWPGQ